ncbi:type III effector protein [Actinoplanes palleronii]|uniref:Type III effector protein n=1 Tax=Actinoplanes palleronii TaxID=113570 RepID=A0ABQ4BR09_9ACTN|nr:type III effector protein [Actinoplanes palleronii]GIE72685.1 hypothetical protein Apa02nite_087930 [Actinoplanes palleronii]
MTETPGPAAEATQWDLTAAAAALAATAAHVGQPAAAATAVSPAELLDALVLLRRTQSELAGLEPVLIAAARAAGVSWQALAPALGVASRQAAERRYLRGASAPTEQPDATRDARVQAERDRRAASRAVARWANDNTADLRRLAGQITALTDLDATAGEALARLHDALGDPDASALPGLLAATQRHLGDHPALTGQIDAVTARTDQIRHRGRPERGDTVT